MTEFEVARVVDALIAAWESGDHQRSETAVRRAAAELDQLSPNSSLEQEIKDLLVGIVEHLTYLLNLGESADPRHLRQLEVCYSLLRHAKAVAAMTIDQEG